MSNFNTMFTMCNGLIQEIHLELKNIVYPESESESEPEPEPEYILNCECDNDCLCDDNKQVDNKQVKNKEPDPFLNIKLELWIKSNKDGFKNSDINLWDNALDQIGFQKYQEPEQKSRFMKFFM